MRAVIVGRRLTSFGVRVIEQNLLLAIAEVSVGLTGFSAIVYLLALFCYLAAAAILFVQFAASTFMPNDQ